MDLNWNPDNISAASGRALIQQKQKSKMKSVAIVGYILNTKKQADKVWN